VFHERSGSVPHPTQRKGKGKTYFSERRSSQTMKARILYVLAALAAMILAGGAGYRVG